MNAMKKQIPRSARDDIKPGRRKRGEVAGNAAIIGTALRVNENVSVNAEGDPRV